MGDHGCKCGFASCLLIGIWAYLAPFRYRAQRNLTHKTFLLLIIRPQSPHEWADACHHEWSLFSCKVLVNWPRLSFYVGAQLATRRRRRVKPFLCVLTRLQELFSITIQGSWLVLVSETPLHPDYNYVINNDMNQPGILYSTLMKRWCTHVHTCMHMYQTYLRHIQDSRFRLFFLLRLKMFVTDEEKLRFQPSFRSSGLYGFKQVIHVSLAEV